MTIPPVLILILVLKHVRYEFPFCLPCADNEIKERSDGNLVEQFTLDGFQDLKLHYPTYAAAAYKLKPHLLILE